MNPILALVGSGEFLPVMEPVDRFLLSQIANPKVAILPTAAGKEPYQKWIADGVKHFTKLGVPVAGIHLIDTASANDPLIIQTLQIYNFFYFSGGDPGYLLDTLQNSNAWEVILDKYKKGAILAGSSAGAMVMGKMVWARIYEYFEKGIVRPWERGLDLVDFGILPHFRQVREEFGSGKFNSDIKKIIPTNIPIVGIEENTAYIKIGNKWITKGEGKVYLDGRKEIQIIV